MSDKSELNRFAIDSEVSDLINKNVNKKVWDIFVSDLDFNYKEFRSDCYKDCLEIFHYVFNLGEKGKIYLWNRLIENINENVKFRKDDYTKEEWEFINLMKKVRENRHPYLQYHELEHYTTKVNKAFKTKRLVIAPMSKDEERNKMLSNTASKEDFEQYHLKKNFYDARYLGEYYKFNFGLYLNKDLIGSISLDYEGNENEDAFDAKLYILNEFRNNGYMKEALTALLDKAFNKKLYIEIASDYRGIIKKDIATINVIRFSIRSDNIAAVKVVKSIGANFDGIKKAKFKSNGKYYDELLYSINNPNFEL